MATVDASKLTVSKSYHTTAQIDEGLDKILSGVVETAAQTAQSAAKSAGESAQKAGQEAAKAQEQAQAAHSSKEQAESARDAIENMTAEAVDIPAGEPATVTKKVDPDTGAVNLTFGIPKIEYGFLGDLSYIVLNTRDRPPGKPDYGLGGGGDDGGTTEAVLNVSSYSGEADISAVVSGTEYDADNMATPAENLPDGTLIIKKLEE